MVTWWDWVRVGAVGGVALGLVAVALAIAPSAPAGSWALATLVGLAVAVLVGQPLLWTNDAQLTSADASGLPLLVGLVTLTPVQLLAAVVVGHAIGWRHTRHRSGLPLATPMGRLKLVANVATNVATVGAALVVMHLLAPAGETSRVVGAIAATTVSEVASLTAVCVVMGGHTTGAPSHHVRVLLQTPQVPVVLLVGGLTAAASLALGHAALWLLLATAGLWLLAVQQTRAQTELVRLRGLMVVAQDLPATGDRHEVLALLQSHAQALTHATTVTVEPTPPTGSSIGVQIDDQPETWLQVHDRSDAGEGFRLLEREILDGLGGLARLALRTVGLTEQLRHEATHDQLTDLVSRRGLEQHWTSAVARAARNGRALGVVYVDLDGFKQVNDLEGHAVGDAVLQETARRLREVARGGDIVCRVGGDEFVLVAEDVPDRVAADALADRVREALATTSQSWPRPIGASVGVARHPDDGDVLGDVLRAADTEMYRAKRRTRNRAASR